MDENRVSRRLQQRGLDLGPLVEPGRRFHAGAIPSPVRAGGRGVSAGDVGARDGAAARTPWLAFCAGLAAGLVAGGYFYGRRDFQTLAGGRREARKRTRS